MIVFIIKCGVIYICKDVVPTTKNVCGFKGLQKLTVNTIGRTYASS